jgi:hypothetical protein
MTKDVNEQFFEEVSAAMEKNDRESMQTLMGAVEEEEVKEPNQEVAAEEIDVETDGTIDEPVDKTRTEEESEEDEDETTKLKRELEEARTAQHRLKSDAGRVPGLQRKLAELDKKLQTMAEHSAKPDSDAEGDASLADAFDNEHFALIRETDPTLAAALQATFNRMVTSTKKQSVEAAREVTNTFREVEEQEDRYREFDKLVSVVPEAPEIFKSPEWTQYKDTLTPNQRQLAESGYAEDVVLAIERFNIYTGKVPSKQAANVSEERARKLTAKVPGSSAASPAQRQETDPEAYFKKIFEEQRKLNQRLY